MGRRDLDLLHLRRRADRARLPVPVVAVPLPLVLPPATDAPLEIEIGDGFTFLFMFDFFSTAERKNPVGLVEAFTRAFSPGEGPQLVVKSFNGDYKPEQLERLRRAARGRPDVVLVDRWISAEQRRALMQRADCTSPCIARRGSAPRSRRPWGSASR